MAPNYSSAIPISDVLRPIKKKNYYTILNFPHFLRPCVSSNTLLAKFPHAVSGKFKAEAGWLSVCVHVVVVTWI